MYVARSNAPSAEKQSKATVMAAMHWRGKPGAPLLELCLCERLIILSLDIAEFINLYLDLMQFLLRRGSFLSVVGQMANK